VTRASRDGLTRRKFLGRTAVLGLSLSAAGRVLSACGDGAASPSPDASADASGRIVVGPSDPRLTYVGRWGFDDAARPTAG
jgi:hypothetical protein